MKSVLWRVAKRLSYIEDARCVKAKETNCNSEPTESLPNLTIYLRKETRNKMF